MVLMFLGGVLLFSQRAGAIVVKCENCTEEYPCAALFEFKNVRFIHNLHCKVDREGREIWDSKDQEKFDMFYFESPGRENEEREVTL